MRILSTCAAAALGIGLLFNTGCEWTGGGGTESFNTSQGAGININFSGVYDGNLGGGRAVASTSGGSITRLTIFQTGSQLDVRDNQGSRYIGSVGTPGAIVDLAETTTIPAGAELVQSQIAWSGKDEVANRHIEFVGVIHAVSVTDIKGNTHNTSDSTTDETQTTTTFVDNENGTITETTTVIGPGFTQITEVVRETATGKEISRNVTRTVTNTTTTTTQFTLTEANSQFRLEGTWIERDGVSANVDALSPGGKSTITTTTTPTPTT